METDPNILIKKARGAIAKYGVDCVVANILQTRYDEVRLVEKETVDVVKRSSEIPLLEAAFIPELIKRHQEFIKSDPSKEKRK